MWLSCGTLLVNKLLSTVECRSWLLDVLENPVRYYRELHVCRGQTGANWEREKYLNVVVPNCDFYYIHVSVES